MRIVPIGLMTLALVAPMAVAQSTATYTVTFESTWSAATHPDGFPGNPHFSGLVGATHGSGTHVWTAGATASPGVEVMAETGGKSPLIAEAEALMGSGAVEFVLSGGGIGTSPGSVALTFDASESHAFVSLVSMVAPSPDWFVGVDGLALRDGDGWISEIVVPLDVYDAGTDSGPDYTSPNQDTDPAEAIAKIEDAPFKVGDALVPVGTFTFALQSVTATDAAPTSLELATVSPNPARASATLRLRRPDASPIAVDVLDSLGRIVQTPKVPHRVGDQTLRIDTRALAPGVYHVRITSATETVIRRLVVQR